MRKESLFFVFLLASSILKPSLIYAQAGSCEVTNITLPMGGTCSLKSANCGAEYRSSLNSRVIQGDPYTIECSCSCIRKDIPLEPGTQTEGATKCDLCGWCSGTQKPPYWDDCNNCIKDGQHSFTALGCLPTSPTGFIEWFLKSVIGIAGGIAFLLILYGGFQVLTSGGDPEKLNNGKDIIVSAIAGVLMIVFSVILLKIIGVDILQIPGFGT